MFEKKAAPVLNDQDLQTAVWKKITAHLEQRIQALRERNDKELDDTKTAKLRGRIAEVKELMALDQPAPSVDADDTEK
ncbi:MAG: hypothetical protein A3E01_08255 [Gammaproteobacteria bacterium RIFCSPHIGHO2_12_FULL_63_22]|nr:MAG: hypothetical protein A3E01_08255 [Gammaproteobacteria bacterium RIFCSPHIGHO2_12_FULL_63_22]